MPTTMTKDLIGATTSASSWSPQQRRRVYIGNMTKDCTQEDVERDLKKYGHIDYIHLAAGKFCFVTFETEAAAILATEDKKYEVRMAREKGDCHASMSETDQGSNMSKNRKKRRIDGPSPSDLMEQLLHSSAFQPPENPMPIAMAEAASQTIEDSSTMLVLQCNKSHLNRLLDYLKSSYTDHLIYHRQSGSDDAVAVPLIELMTSIPQKSKVAFVFLPIKNKEQAQECALILQKDVFLNNALNSVFCVTPNLQHYSLGKTCCSTSGSPSSSSLPSPEIPETLISTLVQQLQDWLAVEPALGDISPRPKMVVRIQTFPAQFSGKISSALLQAGTRLANMDFSPTNFTHVLSVVQLTDEYYMTGLRRNPLFMRNDRVSTGMTPGLKNATNTNQIISRAYFKLSEALTRSSKRKLLDIEGKVALDCGASPGGWTKYLVEQGASRVYSIDPGVLDQTILEMPGVSHMTMTYQEALPKLQQEGVKCDILVSDMCCKDMEEQLVTLLQLARRSNLFNHSAKGGDHECKAGASWFVVTLKCSMGYSEKAYQTKVETVVHRLEQEQLAEQIEVIHLFANRNTERTVIGIIR